MVEECFCCGAFAPCWDAEEYAEWALELTPEGGYLGVICPGCFAGEGLVPIEADPSDARVLLLVRQSRPGRPVTAAQLSEAA